VPADTVISGPNKLGKAVVWFQKPGELAWGGDNTTPMLFQDQRFDLQRQEAAVASFLVFNSKSCSSCRTPSYLERTSAHVHAMSALPPKADMDQHALCQKQTCGGSDPFSDELIYVNAVGRRLTWSVVAQEAD
jgi:hypothetical protein